MGAKHRMMPLLLPGAAGRGGCREKSVKIDMKHLFGLVVCCTVGAWVLNACTPTDDAMGLPKASEEVIALQPVLVEQTRVQLFEPGTNNNFYDTDKGGGEFNVNAYYDGTELKYISNGRVWYRDEDKNWINLDENNQITDYYWPNVGALNFFAYMPKNGYTDKNTYVTVGGYSHANGQQFSCSLPNSNADYDNMQEFIYAYTPGEKKNSEKVKLTFVHPFSLVCFQLGSGSIRMTVNSIELGNIYLNGTFSTGQTSTADNGIGSWSFTGGKETYTATIGKRIPNDVNYNTIFGGPFVMVPQDLSSVSLTLKYEREEAGAENATETKIVNSLTTTEIPKWEPGKRYIYTLSHGDNNEEIYFNVKVVDWDVVDYKNEIDVE